MTHTSTYLQMVEKVLGTDTLRPDRTGTGTRSIFGVNMRFNLSDGTVPLVTARIIPWKKALVELAWMIRGRNDLQWLHKYDVHIWDEWVLPDGTVGDVYGKLWRNFDGYDQLAAVINQLINNPYSRRMVVSCWAPGRQQDCKLPPCHYAWQVYVHVDGSMDLLVNQRSLDLFLGAPWDLFEFGCLLHGLSAICGLKPGTLIWNVGDCHIYTNHVPQCETMIQRNHEDPRPDPSLLLDLASCTSSGLDALIELLPEHAKVSNYAPHPSLFGKVSV